ncbi:MAG TPA: type 4 pilus major pilin [Alphaproteobacteria bacterium]|nr:hypothetical protein [Rhodospirillaceae bacterium]HRJ12292.1 type 4 pilus major pilin [Alphaproteobacteria bacterium]
MKQISGARGFTLLETGLTLTISALIVGALWLYVSSVIENDRKNKFISQTTEIIMNTRRVFANSVGGMSGMNGTTAMTTAAIRSGIFPASMITNGSNRPQDVYGGDVELSHNNITTPPRFRLSMDRVTREGCVALISKIARDEAVRGQYGILGFSASSNLDVMPPSGVISGDLTAARVTSLCQVTNVARGPMPPFALHIDFQYR